MNRRVPLNPIFVWLPRATSILSIFGSAAIIFIILSDRQRKLSRVKNRFMLFMSFFDIFQSIAMLVGTAAIPRSTGMGGAIGSNGTCAMQGFFITLGFAVPLYNASLNLYYTLTISFSMRHNKFAATIEPFLHAASILLPLSMAIAFAALGYYRPVGGLCFTIKKGPVMTHALLIGFCFFASFLAMIIICCTMIRQSIRMRRYSYSPTSASHYELERRETILQAVLYTLVFCLTYTFPFVRSIQSLLGIFNVAFAVSVLTVLLYPMQGFWNFVFYIRPNLKYIRNTNPDRSFQWAFREVIFNAQSIELPSGRRSMMIRRRPTSTMRAVSTVESSLQEARSEQHREETIEEEEDFAQLFSTVEAPLSEEIKEQHREEIIEEEEGFPEEAPPQIRRLQTSSIRAVSTMESPFREESKQQHGEEKIEEEDGFCELSPHQLRRLPTSSIRAVSTVESPLREERKQQHAEEIMEEP